jgi:hypothetical protein
MTYHLLIIGLRCRGGLVGELPLKHLLLKARCAEFALVQEELGRDLRRRNYAHAVPRQEVAEAVQGPRLQRDILRINYPIN